MPSLPSSAAPKAAPPAPAPPVRRVRRAAAAAAVLVLLVLPILGAVLFQRYYVVAQRSSSSLPPPDDYGAGSMFDGIADRYDLVNRVLAGGMDVGWRRRLVAKIQEHAAAATPTATTTTPTTAANVPPPPYWILDVATGTADVALLLAHAMPAAQIVGVDPSRRMLQIGRRKIVRQGLAAAIALRVHDARDDFAAALSRRPSADDDTESETPTPTTATGTVPPPMPPPPPMLFDAATMAFGIRNVPDRVAALCQIRRVLKDNARFGLLEFSEPDAATAGVTGMAAKYFIRHAVPFLGGVLSGKPREYWHLQRSIQNFPSPQEFGKQLEGLECEHSDGAFRLDEIIQMNFGSVQLYVLTAIRRMEVDVEGVSVK